MKRKMHLLLSCILLFVSFVLLGCEEQYRPDGIPEETPEVIETNLESTSKVSIPYISNYELAGGDTAEFLSYDYRNGSMYIAGLKAFEEFSVSNEGGVSINKDENTLTFSIIKATGSITGAVDGPRVYFKMNLATNEIIDKEFKPAPDYAELGITEFIEHSKEVIKLTDKRMVEIGVFFKELIMEIEANYKE